MNRHLWVREKEEAARKKGGERERERARQGERERARAQQEKAINSREQQPLTNFPDQMAKGKTLPLSHIFIVNMPHTQMLRLRGLGKK